MTHSPVASPADRGDSLPRRLSRRSWRLTPLSPLPPIAVTHSPVASPADRSDSHPGAMVFSEYTKQRIPSTGATFNINQEGVGEGRHYSQCCWHLRRYEQHGTIQRLPGSGRRSIVTPSTEATIESRMEDDDETTASQLQTLLVSKGRLLSLFTIQRSRVRMGWTFRGSAYCQLTRNANKEKRLVWAQENLTAALHDGFTDVVWTDEASVQLESHRRHSFRKTGCQPRPKPRYIIHTAYIWVSYTLCVCMCRSVLYHFLYFLQS